MPGARLAHGRAFSAEDGSNAAMIGERLARSLEYPPWISLETGVYRVVGVVDAEFASLPEADIWLPLQNG